MSIILPLAYLSAFLLFLASTRFRGNREELRFEAYPSVESRAERVCFYSGAAAFATMLIYGTFSDPNYTIQEYANLQEIDIEVGEIGGFLFGGNFFGHQHLYHLSIAAIVGLLDLESRESVLMAGRLVSVLFAMGTLVLFKELLLSVPRAIPRTAICFVFVLLPLNFFYFMQAEPYSMLLFLSVLNLRLFLLLGNGSKKVTVAFTAVAILGYLTHYFFLVLLAAEASFVIYLWVGKKRAYRHFGVSMLFVLPVLLATHRSILVMLSSSLIEYQQGYYDVGTGFFLTQLYAIWGLSRAVYGAQIGVTAVVYAALVALLVGTIVKNRRTELTAFLSTIFLSELILFVVFNMITVHRGYMTITLRHYIPTTIPLVLLYFMGRDDGGARARKYIPYALVASALAAYLTSDISFLANPYRVDGRKAGQYLVKMREEKGVKHISIVRWLEGCFINPWLSESGVDAIEGDYYQTDLVDAIKNHEWPTRYEEGDGDDETKMALLWQRLREEGGGRPAARGGSDARKLNAFIATSGVKEILLKRIRSRGVKLPDEVVRIGRIKRRDPREQKEIDALAARLYLELLYPGLKTRENMLDRYVQERRIKKIVRDKSRGERFLFVIMREKIVGMDYFDPKEQYEALRTVRRIKGVDELFRKDFDNVEVYGFRKNRR